MTDHAATKKLLWWASLLAAITVLSIVIDRLTGCSTKVVEKHVVDSQKPPPPGDCDGSPVGDIKKTACSAGDKVEVCTDAGWKTAADPCVVTPPKPCGQVIFAEAREVLSKHCSGCHDSVLQYQTAKTWSAEITRRIGLPEGNPEHMPQRRADGSPNILSSEELRVLDTWRDDGAVDTCDTTQIPSLLDHDYILGAMVRDATNLPSQDRPFARYLVTAHAINSGFSDPELEVWTQAMNKGLNSLAEEVDDLAKAQPVAGGIWRIDLRTFGFGVKDAAALEAGDVNIDIVDHSSAGLILEALIGTKKPWFHLDNFLDVAYRNSSVYYQLVGIPDRLNLLLADTGTDEAGQLHALTANFLGSSASPIAEQKNRLIVRFAEGRSQTAYLWQTFDVNDQPAPVIVRGQHLNRKNLFQFPLLEGAGGRANYAFDASEVIFRLRNGMQAYALFDSGGKRLDFADPNIVIDTQTPLGNKIINAGNSCNRCHNGGLIPMTDQILAHVETNALLFDPGDVRIIEKLYGAGGAGQALFSRDNAGYISALARIGVDAQRPDPISIVTDRFLQNWTAEQTAAFLFVSLPEFQLGLNKSAVAKAQIGQLASGGTVPFLTLVGVLKQLIADAGWFQDPVGG